MNRTFHPAAMLMGAIYTVLGFVFVLEAMDAWRFDFADLVYAGPAALIVIGGGLLATALRRR